MPIRGIPKSRTVRSERLRIVSLWLEVIMVLLRVCVVVALVLSSIGQVTVLKVEGKVETVMEKMVERMVEKVVKHHLNGCHLIFLTTTTRSPLVSSIIRQLGVVGVVADVTAESGDRLWGDQRTTCRAVILLTHNNNNNNNNTNLLLSHVERIGLYKRSEVVVVGVGLRKDVKNVLLHPSLRNTAHALYLAFTPHTTTTTTTPFTTLTSTSTSTSAFTPHDTTSHETDQFRNFQGHVLRLTAVNYFPYVTFERETEEQETPVTFTDSVDVRILHTFTKKLNISYKVRDAPNRTWGAYKDGVFYGMMGKLYREEADMCTSSGPTPSRFKAVDYLRIHPSDHTIVTSLQPALLPQYLAIVTPFSDEVWLSLLGGVVGWSVIMWALQLVWTRMVAEGGRGISFSKALMFGWGALLEQTYPDPSLSVSGQLLVGWWLVFCVVITTGFRSSLVAHLTVQGKAEPIDSFEDMVAQKGWRWGTEETLFKGAHVEYFAISQDPVVQKANSDLEEEESLNVALKLGHMQGAFYLFALGVVVAIFVFLLETIFPPSNTHKQTTPSYSLTGVA
ncbi:hypothetical protein Pmani_036671 [Petrolisthes manimaculis]|uniref:Ionotropic glutamate receptor L-glutamate and glycine-binding domain-containing protein n=1 Tax=Petrolisthes manimaculis TaxID=1843537 RepID=A0AAE1TP53_9EUCA|nr:hypothetical protein Pmani_036671 [Petrolisthes manimaculis]